MVIIPYGVADHELLQLVFHFFFAQIPYKVYSFNPPKLLFLCLCLSLSPSSPSLSLSPSPSPSPSPSLPLCLLGAFMPKPDVQKLGLAKVFACAIPGIYIGATVAREGAAFLEENDIFVPDDDDD